MRRALPLAILPLLGVAFIATALFWNKRELRLRLWGEAVEGRVVGMVVQRTGSADLLTGLDTSLVLVLANGDRITANYRNYHPLDGHDQASGLTAELRRVLDDGLRGDAAVLRWALLRESRRTHDARRVLRIEKTERIRGYFAVPVIPEVMGMHNEKLSLAEEGGPSTTEGTTVIQAVFDQTDAAATTTRKGETLVSYDYRRNGEEVEPAKRDFFLSAEPYTTEFRPVFAFHADGKTVARLSHIGRHGGPTLALRLYSACRVYYDPRDPSDAIVFADPGPVGGQWLTWFSRACEGLLSQWGSGALIVVAGSLFVLVGLIVISLAVWPSRRLTAPPPDSAIVPRG